MESLPSTIIDIKADIQSSGQIVWLIENGTEIKVGDAIAHVTFIEGNIEVHINSPRKGKVDQVCFSEGDKINPG